MRTLARSIWSKLVRSVRSEDAHRPRARTLSDLAGTANALVHSRTVRSRRGTFLVLVVGTLALLSVIAIVYVTIGTQDTRVQAAAVKREKIEDVPQRVGDYLAEIIAQDRLATFYDDKSLRAAGSPNNSIPILMREISDYPLTDPQVRSDDEDPSAVADLRHTSWRFDPAGRIDPRFWTNSNEIRSAVPPSDPWLSASEPTWIGVDPDQPEELADPTDVTRLYRDMKDWGHISNFAPNGRFVNLYNLRGNFNARPGTGAGEMSFGLSLIAQDGTPTTQTFFGVDADSNVPFLWDTNQRGAARPAAFVPYGAAAGLATENPANINFKLYQWADADGDGVLDSRWFELVDDRGGITNYLGDTGQYRYFIAARAVDLSARVNVNVATDVRSAARQDAPLGVTPGDVDLLRILAMADSYDFNAPASAGEVLGGGYDNFRNGGGPLVAGNYGPPNAGTPTQADQLDYPPPNIDAGYSRNRAFQVADYGYAALRLSIASGSPFGQTSLDGTVALRGDALITTVGADLNINPASWDLSSPLDGAARRRDVYERFAAGRSGVYDSASGWNSTVRFSLPDLSELLTRNSVNDPDITTTLELVLGGRDNTTATPGPGSSRYSPLRDNRDLTLELAAVPNPAYDVPNPYDNNGADSVNTQLEAFEARYLAQMQTDVRQRITTLSGAVPLRPKRGVSITGLGIDELPTDIGAILDPEYDIYDTLDQVVVQGTPFNRVRPIARVDPSEIKSIFRAYADQLLPFSGATVNNVAPWELGARVGGEMQTASYGYRGPEVALYAAAHMSVNFADLADRERMTKNNNDDTDPIDLTTFDDDYELNIPSVFTLFVRGDAGDPLGFARTRQPVDANDDDFYIGDKYTAASITDNRDLNLNAMSPDPANPVVRLPELRDGDALTVTPQDQLGVNVFGIEAQPFLTRVSVFTTYFVNDDGSGGGGGPGGPGSSSLQLDVSMNQANQDFGYRVVAWQLTNPFNVPIMLWDNAPQGTNAREAESPTSRYYIEMDGRTYLIRPLQANGNVFAQATPPASPTFPQSDRNIIIYPQRTIVVYTLSETPDVIATRVGDRFTSVEVLRAVQNTLGEISLNDPGDPGFLTANPEDYEPDLTKFQAMYYIGAVDPAAANPRIETAIPATSVAFNKLITTDRPESRLWRRVRTVGQLNLGSGGAGGPAPVEFDQLLDRLRVPDGDGDPTVATDPDVYPVLNRRLGDPVNDNSTSILTIDTTGLNFDKPVITLWASVRRPANPGQPPMGALPAYCLEPKGSSRWNVFNNDRFDVGSGTWDPINSVMPRTTWTLDADMFADADRRPNDDEPNSAYRNFNDWRTSVLRTGFAFLPDDGGAPANEDDAPPMLNVVPNLWGTPGVNENLATLVGNSSRPDGSGATQSASNADRFNPLIPQTRYYNQWYPQVALNNALFAVPQTNPAANERVARTRSIRVADMLMPLAVGPTMNPAFPSNDSADSGTVQSLSGREWTNMELRWTTLGEAMAIALGYQPTVGAADLDTLDPSDIATLKNPYSIDPTYSNRNVYIRRPLFDRGQLRLDEFVLFRDLNENGRFDYASDGVDSDIRLFTEAPAALGILDSFTVAPVNSSKVQGGAQEGVFLGLPKEREVSDLTRPVPGLVNINTASPSVLRAVPGLAPWHDIAQQNEIQRITFLPAGGAATDPARGNFNLAYGSVNADSAITVEAAIAGGLQAYLESITSTDPSNPGIGPGNVKVTLVTLNPPTFDIEFIGALAGIDVPALVVGSNTLDFGTLQFSQVQAAIAPAFGPRWTWANGSVLDRDVDLAAVVAATRDKSRQFLRPQSSVSNFTVTQAGLSPGTVSAVLDPDASTGFAVEQLSFFDRETGVNSVLASRELIWPTGFASDEIQEWLEDREGRRAITEIRGISEREGFMTLGAVQAAASVRDANPDTDRLTGYSLVDPTDLVPLDFGPLPISIDFMGYKAEFANLLGVTDANGHDMLYGEYPRVKQDTSQPGLTSSLFPTELITSADRVHRDRVTPDAIPGDYMEKLTPMAAMSNVATTRSDFFAVWFVVHGYTEADVVGLDANPNDPMTPSVARRFLMIVDRSNVVRSGQRPNVVLFREVPYTP